MDAQTNPNPNLPKMQIAVLGSTKEDLKKAKRAQYRHTHRERIRNRDREYRKRYRNSHREQIRQNNLRYRETHREKVRAMSRLNMQRWRKNNLAKVRAKYKLDNMKRAPIRLVQYHELRHKVLAHYGAICSCCGETMIQCLSIDHIDGNGSTHRKTIGKQICNWLAKNNYPMGFQVLCLNCNFAKGKSSICPHQLLSRMSLN